MSHSQSMVVATEQDVMQLRMNVREMARALGMSLTEQARVAMAASAVAKALNCHWQVTIEDFSCDERSGLRVTYLSGHSNGKLDYTRSMFADAKWMADELTLENPGVDELKVTLVKWLGGVLWPRSTKPAKSF
jgi:hypothetical protein